jgi:translation initiation factor 1
MGKKNKKGIMYSTNPDYEFEYENEDQDAIDPSAQNLRVLIDRKKRRGKEVTLITGFIGPEEDMKELGKLLKQKLGVGGSAKDGEIIVQGNHREKVLAILKEKGFAKTKLSGG